MCVCGEGVRGVCYGGMCACGGRATCTKLFLPR